MPATTSAIIDIYGPLETLHCLNYISNKIASTATYDDIQDDRYKQSLYLLHELQKMAINQAETGTNS